MRILVFGAHQDDESIGMAGTIYKHTKRGDEVKVVFMTDGSGGSIDVDPKELSRIREKEAVDACKVLGVNNLEFFRFKDGFLTYSYEPLVKTGKVIRSFKPHRIYVHHADAPSGEENLDHINTFKLVKEAVFRVQYKNYPELGEDVWRVPELYAYEVCYPIHEPNAFVDITDVVEIKKEAIRQHRSQMVAQPYWENVGLSLNRWRGLFTGLGDYVEAFKALRTSLF
ncbi:MAG: PIG-L deacetylase family protein [Candidatus Bathyarchaeia archaeon]